MPKELFEEVKDEIPSHIGVYINGVCAKNPKKQELSVDEKILKDSLIRSLCREVQKKFKSDDPWYINIQERQIAQYKKEADDYKHKYWDLMRIGKEKYGSRWYKDY